MPLNETLTPLPPEEEKGPKTKGRGAPREEKYASPSSSLGVSSASSSFSHHVLIVEGTKQEGEDTQLPPRTKGEEYNAKEDRSPIAQEKVEKKGKRKPPEGSSHESETSPSVERTPSSSSSVPQVEKISSNAKMLPQRIWDALRMQLATSFSSVSQETTESVAVEVEHATKVTKTITPRSGAADGEEEEGELHLRTCRHETSLIPPLLSPSSSTTLRVAQTSTRVRTEGRLTRVGEPGKGGGWRKEGLLPSSSTSSLLLPPPVGRAGGGGGTTRAKTKATAITWAADHEMAAEVPSTGMTTAADSVQAAGRPPSLLGGSILSSRASTSTTTTPISSTNSVSSSLRLRREEEPIPTFSSGMGEKHKEKKGVGERISKENTETEVDPTKAMHVAGTRGGPLSALATPSPSPPPPLSGSTPLTEMALQELRGEPNTTTTTPSRGGGPLFSRTPPTVLQGSSTVIQESLPPILLGVPTALVSLLFRQLCDVVWGAIRATAWVMEETAQTTEEASYSASTRIPTVSMGEEARHRRVQSGAVPPDTTSSLAGRSRGRGVAPRVVVLEEEEKGEEDVLEDGGAPLRRGSAVPPLEGGGRDPCGRMPLSPLPVLPPPPSSSTEVMVQGATTHRVPSLPSVASSTSAVPTRWRPLRATSTTLALSPSLSATPSREEEEGGDASGLVMGHPPERITMGTSCSSLLSSSLGVSSTSPTPEGNTTLVGGIRALASSSSSGVASVIRSDLPPGYRPFSGPEFYESMCDAVWEALSQSADGIDLTTMLRRLEAQEKAGDVVNGQRGGGGADGVLEKKNEKKKTKEKSNNTLQKKQRKELQTEDKKGAGEGEEVIATAATGTPLVSASFSFSSASSCVSSLPEAAERSATPPVMSSLLSAYSHRPYVQAQHIPPFIVFAPEGLPSLHTSICDGVWEVLTQFAEEQEERMAAYGVSEERRARQEHLPPLIPVPSSLPDVVEHTICTTTPKKKKETSARDGITPERSSPLPVIRLSIPGRPTTTTTIPSPPSSLTLQRLPSSVRPSMTTASPTVCPLPCPPLLGCYHLHPVVSKPLHSILGKYPERRQEFIAQLLQEDKEREELQRRGETKKGKETEGVGAPSVKRPPMTQATHFLNRLRFPLEQLEYSTTEEEEEGEEDGCCSHMEDLEQKENVKALSMPAASTSISHSLLLSPYPFASFSASESRGTQVSERELQKETFLRRMLQPYLFTASLRFSPSPVPPTSTPETKGRKRKKKQPERPSIALPAPAHVSASHTTTEDRTVGFEKGEEDGIGNALPLPLLPAPPTAVSKKKKKSFSRRSRPFLYVRWGRRETEGDPPRTNAVTISTGEASSGDGGEDGPFHTRSMLPYLYREECVRREMIFWEMIEEQLRFFPWPLHLGVRKRVLEALDTLSTRSVPGRTTTIATDRIACPAESALSPAASLRFHVPAIPPPEVIRVVRSWLTPSPSSTPANRSLIGMPSDTAGVGKGEDDPSRTISSHKQGCSSLTPIPSPPPLPLAQRILSCIPSSSSPHYEEAVVAYMQRVRLEGQSIHGGDFGGRDAIDYGNPIVKKVAPPLPSPLSTLFLARERKKDTDSSTTSQMTSTAVSVDKEAVPDTPPCSPVLRPQTSEPSAVVNARRAEWLSPFPAIAAASKASSSSSVLGSPMENLVWLGYQHPAAVEGQRHIAAAESFYRKHILQEEEAFREQDFLPLFQYEHRLRTVRTLPLERFLRRWIQRYRGKKQRFQLRVAHLIEWEKKCRADVYASNKEEVQMGRFLGALESLQWMEQYNRREIQLMYLRSSYLHGVIHIRLQEQVERFPIMFGAWGKPISWRCVGLRLARVAPHNLFWRLHSLEQHYRNAIVKEEEKKRKEDLSFRLKMCAYDLFDEQDARRSIEEEERRERAPLEYYAYVLLVMYAKRDVECYRAVTFDVEIERSWEVKEAEDDFSYQDGGNKMYGGKEGSTKILLLME